MDQRQAITALSALAEDTRMSILRYLVRQGPDGATAGDVGKSVGATSSRASFHLSKLEAAGIVSSEKSARFVIYRADLDRVGALLGYLLHDCCRGDPKVRRCC